MDACDLRARPVLSHAGAKTSASGRIPMGRPGQLSVPSHVKIRRPGIAVNSRRLKATGRATFDTSIAHGPKRAGTTDNQAHSNHKQGRPLLSRTTCSSPKTNEKIGQHFPLKRSNRKLGSISPLNPQSKNWAAFPPLNPQTRNGLAA